MSHTASDIAAELGVAPKFDAQTEIERRVDFLSDYLTQTGARGYVLGISGGVDSTTAGRLAQLAVQACRSRGLDVTFTAVRLPYGEQRDEADAQRALDFIQPDRTVTIDIKPATDGMAQALETPFASLSAEREDFVRGNIKARQRMIAQYALAGADNALVIGTDHAAEALMGFFTKFGDGAADVVPLSGLTKRRVRAVAQALGAPDSLVQKVPTADLESLSPQKADEDAFGLTYETIDDFLEGKAITPADQDIILSTYHRSAHKRALPVAPAAPECGSGARP